MYASIRQYRVSARDTDEIVRLVQSGFVPIIRAVNGFREYHLIAGNNGELTTVSLFDNQASAEESARKASGWVQQNLAQYLQGTPQASTGQVMVDEHV